MLVGLQIVFVPNVNMMLDVGLYRQDMKNVLIVMQLWTRIANMKKIQYKNHRCARCGTKRATLGKYCDDCWRIIYG